VGSVIDPLNHVLFHLGNDAVTWAELLGFVTGLLTVALTVRVSVHCFWTGILNSAFFLLLFWDARLWADGALQGVYIVMGFWGWAEWLWGGPNRSRLVIRRTPTTQLVLLASGVPLATYLLWLLLSHNNDVAPFWDALTTALSLAAQYLLNTKRIEQWVFWVIADVIYVPLYLSKALALTGIVYVCFLTLALTGGIVWWRAWRDQRPIASEETVGLVRA
jgi:nicotinamide mononucleotide transporter